MDRAAGLLLAVMEAHDSTTFAELQHSSEPGEKHAVPPVVQS